MRATVQTFSRRVTLAALFVSGISANVGAQLPNASAAAFGMGGNFTAVAKGYEAVAWNPANLGMPGRPFLSIGIGIVGGSAGMDPIDVSALNAFSGQVVDSVTRVAWIDKVRVAGGQRINADAGFTPLALSVGPVGFQLGAATYSNARLSPDAWEAWLFGNAGRSGTPQALDFSGTTVNVGAITSGGLSFALPIPINLTNGILHPEHAAIGFTAKYVRGQALLVAQDNGSSFATNGDVLLNLPVIVNAENQSFSKGLGNGVGADLSAAWSGGPWKVGLLMENVFNTFRWDTTELAFRPGTGTFNINTKDTDFDQQSYAAAPQSLKDLVTSQRLKPALALGASFQVLSSLTLSADMKRYTGGDEAIIVGPKSHFGVGAEWRVLPFVPLRGGVASVTGGWQVGAGVGLAFGNYELGLSTSLRQRGQATESGLMIGLVSIGR